DRHPLRDLRLGDERSGAAAARQVALADELVERRAHGEARDAEVAGQVALGRDRVADLEALDQIEHTLAGFALLRHPATIAGLAAPVRMRAPVSTEKNWKRPGSSASSRRLPTRAAVRLSTRAVKSARWEARSRSSPASASSTSAVIGGESTWKKTYVSDPSSS